MIRITLNEEQITDVQFSDIMTCLELLKDRFHMVRRASVLKNELPSFLFSFPSAEQEEMALPYFIELSEEMNGHFQIFLE